ncbi:MAG TPA: hypothetical protein PKH42_07885 [Sedimentibacter sp.]|nr:hypothetical protein [Sedimentibacter sp.]HOA20391.1 hypothetical protein [Sedimentibacter sp.]HOG63612.1 hypothetical protein [Sedimentibacter sp.]
MEGLVILIIWALINSFIRSANKKDNEGKTQKRTTQTKRKNIFSTFIEEIEKEMQSEKEKHRLEGPAQRTQPSQSARTTQWAKPPQPALPKKQEQPSMLSDLPKSKVQTKPAPPPKPVGLEIDAIGGDEEIGGIKEARISKGSKNNLDLNLNRDILKGIIYSEILSKPKSLRNMKIRC